MNQKQIKYIANKHYRELKKHIKKVAADFDVEDIHQFRVAYKKLRAFLRMISNKDIESRKIKISKKLKKAYHIAGAIRNVQLQRQRIIEATEKELKKPVDYLTLLDKEIDRLKPQFAEIVSKRPVAEMKKKIESAIPGKFSALDLNLFIQKKWDAGYAIIETGHFDDNEIHAIRKNLKDLFYNLKIYDASEQQILSQGLWKGKNESYFYQLLDEMGAFQDTCTAIALLKDSRLHDLKKDDREQVERIKENWIENKRRMKKLLVKKLRSANAYLQTG